MAHLGITIPDRTETMKLRHMVMVVGSLACVAAMSAAPQREVRTPGQFATRVRINFAQVRLFNERAVIFEGLASSTRIETQIFPGQGNGSEATQVLHIRLVSL